MAYNLPLTQEIEEIPLRWFVHITRKEETILNKDVFHWRTPGRKMLEKQKVSMEGWKLASIRKMDTTDEDWINRKL